MFGYQWTCLNALQYSSQSCFWGCEYGFFLVLGTTVFQSALNHKPGDIAVPDLCQHGEL